MIENFRWHFKVVIFSEINWMLLPDPSKRKLVSFQFGCNKEKKKSSKISKISHFKYSDFGLKRQTMHTTHSNYMELRAQIFYCPVISAALHCAKPLSINKWKNSLIRTRWFCVIVFCVVDFFFFHPNMGHPVPPAMYIGCIPFLVTFYWIFVCLSKKNVWSFIIKDWMLTTSKEWFLKIIRS